MKRVNPITRDLGANLAATAYAEASVGAVRVTERSPGTAVSIFSGLAVARKRNDWAVDIRLMTGGTWTSLAPLREIVLACLRHRSHLSRENRQSAAAPER